MINSGLNDVQGQIDKFQVLIDEFVDGEVAEYENHAVVPYQIFTIANCFISAFEDIYHTEVRVDYS